MNETLTRRERFASFVERHKVALAVTATAVVTTIVVSKTVNGLRDDNLNAALEVLQANDLMDQFENHFEEN